LSVRCLYRNVPSTYIEAYQKPDFSDWGLEGHPNLHAFLKYAVIISQYPQRSRRHTYSLSCAWGPLVRFISKRCSFLYLSTISPFSEIHIEVLLILPESFSSPGSWIPPVMHNLLSLASFCNPSTYKLVSMERTRVIVSSAE
jgi:hypothetical protein